MKSIDQKLIKQLNENYQANTNQHILKAAILNNGLETVATNFEHAKLQSFVFSHEIRTLPVTNQMQSGRCWLFAGLNILREVVALKYDLKQFELSQSYLAFWDKFEKVNYFIESMDDFMDVPQDDRTLNFLLKEGIQDGGQWDMFVSLVEKYGVVPKQAMPETYQSSHTGFLNKMINFRLRKYVSDLRSKTHDTKSLKEETLNEIYQLLVSSYGMPVETFDFEFKTQNNEYFRFEELTPQSFYKDHVNHDLNDYISVIHAPTKDKPYYQTYSVKYLGNVVGGKEVKHLNVPMDVLKELTIKQLTEKVLVWFGCDVANFGDRKKGVWDDRSYQYDQVYGLNLTMNKEDKLDYLQSQMNHAMVLTGVHIVDGKPQRFKIQNSWGSENGYSGFYLASDSWFENYTYQVVIQKQYLNDKLLKALQKEVILLNPWDPMGSLAK